MYYEITELPEKPSKERKSRWRDVANELKMLPDGKAMRFPIPEGKRNISATLNSCFKGTGTSIHTRIVGDSIYVWEWRDDENK